MQTKELILKEVRKKGFVRSADIVRRTGISRQTIAKHLRELTRDQKLVKLGKTHNARYVPHTKETTRPKSRAPSFDKRYRIKGLEEDRVFAEVALKLRLTHMLSAGAYRITQYAFTEMLNNAIDHSSSVWVMVKLMLRHGTASFHIRDAGEGAFETLRRKFRLRDHFEASEHLLKGKQSADPACHTGQGIFFTSKIADRFVLESAKLRLLVDDRVKDTFLEDTKFIKGTVVQFEIKQKSRKDLKALFDEYSDDDYEFDKTRITVRLSKKRGGHISRSEAKRLLFGLDKFKRIVLDFNGVTAIGQGFADEIFRVFQVRHPRTQLEVIDAVQSVDHTIKRARRELTIKSE